LVAAACRWMGDGWMQYWMDADLTEVEPDGDAARRDGSVNSFSPRLYSFFFFLSIHFGYNLDQKITTVYDQRTINIAVAKN
jgi:hypothetical protein